MPLIIIHLSPRLGSLGSFILKSDQGEIVLGPVPIATPLTVGSEKSEPKEGEARLRVAGVVRMDGATSEDLRAFGRFGIVVLVSEKEAEKGSPPLGELQDGLFIYGGVRETEGAIECPQNAFRLMPEHHRKLVKLLDNGLSCAVQIMPGAPGDQAVEGRTVATVPNVGVQIARLAAAAVVVASPFLMTAKANAQSSSSCYDSGQSFSAVDFSTLAARQGGTQYTGSVPSSSSGVTIAAGVDLGKKTEQDLVAMGLNEKLVAKLSPYLAPSPAKFLTGARARRVLAGNPLLVSAEEAAEINLLFFTWHANAIGSLFNSRLTQLGRTGDFARLPTQLQTTMTNMFLVDASFPRSDVFDRFAHGDSPGGVERLKSYKGGSSLATARAREAAQFLRRSILK